VYRGNYNSLQKYEYIRIQLSKGFPGFRITQVLTCLVFLHRKKQTKPNNFH